MKMSLRLMTLNIVNIDRENFVKATHILMPQVLQEL